MIRGTNQLWLVISLCLLHIQLQAPIGLNWSEMKLYFVYDFKFVNYFCLHEATRCKLAIENKKAAEFLEL